MTSCDQNKRETVPLDEPPSEQSVGTFEKLSAEEFKSRLESNDNIQLVDVRRPEEYAEGYLKNATNINFYDSDFMGQILEDLDKSEPVYLYCRSGGRSGKAAIKLSEKGFKVYDLRGG
ncbi:MAG: rhodanese-like domain-containing protein, partial [Flavobacteriaceae bacterium]|nr:rhodanese-like domain-containing protein [Flavobacteriaceae bacterium]